MNGRNLLGIAFRVIGLAFAVIAAVVAVFTAAFLSRSIQVTGTVVANSHAQNEITLMPDSSETGVLYYPVISYEADGGSQHEFVGPQGRSKPQFAEGDRVQVLVSERNPGDARLDTLLGVWGTPIILGALALIFFVLSLAAPLGFGGSRRQ